MWASARALLRARIGDANYASWIVPLRCAWSDGGLALEAPDQVTRDTVARHFEAAIGEAAAAILGRPCPVELRIAAPLPAPLPIRGVPPSPDHTFDTFVVGESNARACSEARAVLSGPPRPALFLHGPSGVGKTHLLHAIFHALDARGVTVACLPAARLVTALVAAYGGRGHEAFWQELRPLEALLLDDVHSLAGQEEVQERLMDGLVAWQASGRLLVLTSDRAPVELPELAARVRQRFAGGVVAAVEPPEPALRLAILQHKATALGLRLDPGLAARIAAAIAGDVRRLEGALTRLLAHARIFGRRVDDALALEVLAELRPRPAAAAVTVTRILGETAAAFGTPAATLRGRSRRPELGPPRQVAMYLARKLLRLPFAELATAFVRDRTTVLHAWQAVTVRLETDRRLAAIIAEVEQRLTGAAR